MPNPKISIIVPFFNRANLFLETLDSISAQNYNDYEVLIIDDGSDTQEVQIIKKYLNEAVSGFKLLERPTNYPKGANGCRNYGFKIARGEYVKWFDSDDLMEKNFLDMQIRCIERDNYDGILANCGIYDEDFTTKLTSGWRKLFFSENPLQDYLRTQLAWPTPSGLWNKKSIESLKPFSQNLANSQEWIFHLYVLTSNLKIGVIENELFKIRSHKNSISFKNRDKTYLLNRFKARIIALSRLIETRNSGKRYLLKSSFNMVRKSGVYVYPLFLRILLQNLSFRMTSKNRITLIKSEIF